MANKLAGQRAKFSRARAIYYSSGDEAQRQRAAELMAQVIAEAPANGFSEEEVTQGEDVPDEARSIAGKLPVTPVAEEDPNELIAALQPTVDTSDVLELGQGEEFVYAYGYACAPDRLKIGRCIGDPVSRVAAQISTGTPDKPSLRLVIRTHDCPALERTLHGLLRLRGRKVEGAGAEWFTVTRDDLVEAYGQLNL